MGREAIGTGTMDGDERPASGFFGKIPARADFVVAGLPVTLVRPWDRFFSSALTASKAGLADRWTEIWLQAPVWRFALPAALCGPFPMLGLWMPSIDKVGRYFPLMIAATCPAAACPATTVEPMARHGTAWLDAAEDAGRAAIADTLSPEQLIALIPPPPDLPAAPDAGLPHALQPCPGAGLWWTDGAPLVPAQGLVSNMMPDATTFVAMLDAGYRGRF